MNLNNIWVTARLSKYGKQNRLYILSEHSQEREKLNNIRLRDEHL